MNPLSTATNFRLDITPSQLERSRSRSHWTVSVKVVITPPAGLARTTRAFVVADLPWRSFEQMRRKVTQGTIAQTAAAGLEGSVGGHWKTLAELPTHELMTRSGHIVAGEPAEGVVESGWPVRECCAAHVAHLGSRWTGPFVGGGSGSGLTEEPAVRVPSRSRWPLESFPCALPGPLVSGGCRRRVAGRRRR